MRCYSTNEFRVRESVCKQEGISKNSKICTTGVKLRWTTVLMGNLRKQNGKIHVHKQRDLKECFH